ncbi:hypothetical protein HPP92_020626 [Vanilla planifolia]|uniref:Protein kinase domain-containing protein n=1 Tax=Vanilla planifolia TaxID=51239 RepID=A0A835Q0U2_VANPL|nr:hypothetical protein HPP92_020626 [Vanilla planifolia]
MVVEKGFADEVRMERRCIVVGLQIDGDGRELLSWALTNVAEEGDRVVAVNVLRNQDSSKTPTLIQILDDCLSEHEDLFTRKKIILAGRVCRGNSIKKALLKEAELLPANILVVGANKNYSFGGLASLAKYCAKKLPPNIALIAVHKGKVILRREEATKSISVGEQKKPRLVSFLHPSVAMEGKAFAPCSHTTKSDDPKTRRVSVAGSKDARHSREVSKNNRLFAHDGMRESKRSSLTLLVRKLPEPRPGWPLLRRAVTANVEASKEIEARKMSVVQWVMKLPDRSVEAAQSQVNLVKDLEIILGINSSSCKFFQYEELLNSTNYFSPEKLIGKGGNSQVYKGCLPNGQQVAIKVSKLSEETSKDFLLEVDIITRLQHEYVVPLIGICIEDCNLISVYSYCSNGSLEDNLHGKRSKAPLDWDTRFKVAIGVAEAISYVHDGCSRPVVHRDVKSSNILLSGEFKSQLSDFGLATWGPTTSPYLIHSDVVGTFGYLAPEYFMYGKLSRKVDVYAFGVVLLELLTGRKPISDERPKGEESLVMWAKPILDKGDIVELLDPKLEGQYVEEQMKRMALVASLCIRRSAHRRPQMSQVLSLLRGEEEIGPCTTEKDCPDEETYFASSIGSHLGLALLDVDDDASVMSFEQNYMSSLDEYLRDRWSRSSSFE